MSEPAKKDSKTRKGSQRITVYCLPEEKKRIEDNAKSTGKTASSFLLAVGQGYQVNGIVDAEQVREMATISGNLGRLGGLLKWWLTNDARTAEFTPDTVRLVLSKIEDLQQELGATMSQVIRPRSGSDKVKGVPFSDVKAKAFMDPKVLEAYLAEIEAGELEDAV